MNFYGSLSKVFDEVIYGELNDVINDIYEFVLRNGMSVLRKSYSRIEPRKVRKVCEDPPKSHRL